MNLYKEQLSIEKIYKDFDEWEKINKEIIKKIFIKDDNTMKLLRNFELAKKIKSLDKKSKIIDYISSSIEYGKDMDVFTFLIAFHKKYSMRNKLASVILEKEIDIKWLGIPAGQAGIKVDKLKNQNHEFFNKLSYYLLYLCEYINLDSDLNIWVENKKLGNIKHIASIYKNVFYLLCPQKFYPSDSKTKSLLKKKYNYEEEPLLFKNIKNKYQTRLDSLEAFIGGNIMVDLTNKNVKDFLDILKNNYQIILQGPPGTGKTRLSKIIAVNLVSGQNVLCLYDNNEKIKKEFEKLKDQIKIIQFHPSYSYEDFVRGIVAKTTSKGIRYKVENKILAKMAEEAQKEFDKEKMKNKNDEEILEKCKKFVLIIDEINRANLSSVLGELIYALEYRGEEVESMYELNGNRKIVLPKNLYIIGTMNTADRSVGHIDYAIRRRFTFIDVLPDKSVITNSKAKQLFEAVEKIFDDYLSSEFDKNDVMIGHSYFLDDDLENALEYKIKPLLLEYVKDGVLKDDAKEEIEKLKV